MDLSLNWQEIIITILAVTFILRGEMAFRRWRARKTTPSPRKIKNSKVHELGSTVGASKGVVCTDCGEGVNDYTNYSDNSVRCVVCAPAFSEGLNNG